MTWLYIPLSCAQASECSAKGSELHSDFSASTAEPFVTWSGKPVLPDNLPRLWKRERLMKRLSGLTFEPSTAQRGADAWIASLRGSHARTFLSLASELDSTESVPASSSTSYVWPKIAVRGSSFWRTSQASLLPPPPLWTKPKENSSSVRLPESWENWPTSGGLRNGCIFARPTSVLITNESAGSASPGAWATLDCNDSTYSNGKFGPNIREQVQKWATPQAHDAGEGKTPEQIAVMRAGGHGVSNLNEMAAHWATPDANATERTNRSQSDGAAVRPTLALAAAQWSTPQTPNGGRSVSAEVVASRGKTDQGKRQVGLESEVRHWATPTARDHKDGATSMENVEVNGLLGRQVLTTSLRPVLSTIDGRELSPTDRTLRRRLNPAFACWLMGWPIWWTNPGVTSSVKPEMELWRSRLQRQLSCFFAAPASREAA